MTGSPIPGWECAERAVHAGMSWRTAIQRHVPMPSWPAAIAQVPDAHRAETESYLRGMSARERAVRAAQRQEAK